MGASALIESLLRYHPSYYATLTQRFDYKRNRARDENQKKETKVQIYIFHDIQSVPSDLYYSHLLANENKRINHSHFVFSALGTVLGGEFNWGGCLLKCNGGAQRWANSGWKSE